MNILKFNLKSALNQYEAKTGIRLSYEELSEISGVSTNTLKSLASRKNYNATFQLISEISNALHINPIEHFEWENVNE